jgi:hypothetical protein
MISPTVVQGLIDQIVDGAMYPADKMKDLLTDLLKIASPTLQSVTMSEGGNVQLAENVGYVILSTAVSDFTVKLPANPYTDKVVWIHFNAALAGSFLVLNSANAVVFAEDSLTQLTSIAFICTNGTTNSWALIAYAPI